MRKPNIRRLIVDSCRLAHRKNHISFFSDLDVTEARSAWKDAGVAATAGFAKVLGDLISEKYLWMTSPFHPWGGPAGGPVDVEYLVEKEVAGRRIPFASFLRRVECKPLEALEAEVRLFRNQPESGYHPFAVLPGPVRRLIVAVIARHPRWRQETFGTFSITSVGSISRHCGWLQPLSAGDFAVAIGSKEEKEGRTFQKFTFLFNHDLIDGGDCGRFIDEFQERLKSFGKGTLPQIM